MSWKLVSEKGYEPWIMACFAFQTQVNAVDALGESALHRAAAAGQISSCRVLLTHGADISLRSFQGHTAAEVASEPVQKILQGENNQLSTVHTVVRFYVTFRTLFV